MKRMYRVAALLLLLVLLLGITAQADVIWEPNNAFYQAHKKECEEYGRTHYINAKKGALGVYASPKGRTVLDTLQNSTKIYVHNLFGDKAWGLVSYSGSGGRIEGWIKMDETVLKYDNQSFFEEYSDQFYEDTDYIGRTSLGGIDRNGRICTYLYPGSNDYLTPIAGSTAALGYHYKFKNLFEDENGRIWGDLGDTKYGYNWICLSDPQNLNLPEIVRQEVSLYPASDIEIESNLTPAWVLPTCLVVGVAVVSFVLILVLKKKKSSGD